ncbi:MAG: S41 family peptidase [Candidatus Gastranaerophilales bacterium]|nr:S41 family peptidase [Candidatus Gastranaerophilales bacterium]
MKIVSKKTFIILNMIFMLFISGMQSGFAVSPDQLYDEVWRLINLKYVDQTDNSQDWDIWRHRYDGKMKTKEDAYAAIDTMLASLNDPYTRFLDPKEFAEETSSIKGSLQGIGIQIGMKDGNLVVIAPIEDSPADKAGILTDDLILEIDGVSTKGITIDKAADRIRGNSGTQVTLLIKRKDVEPKKYTITRAEIEIKSVSVKTPIETKIPDSVQYIRLSSFISKNAAAEVLNILKTTSSTKKGYILDLRSNPGGLLSNAVLMSDMFLQGGGIVSTVDRYGYKDTTKAAKIRITNKPLVVLVNKGSASASEIFSGAMKDNGRAILVGEQTFGKGLVQEINKLSDDAGLNVTIQRYLTPNGTDIHKKGITPDYIIKLTADDVKNKNDVQLKEGLKILLKELGEPVPDYLNVPVANTAKDCSKKADADNSKPADVNEKKECTENAKPVPEQSNTEGITIPEVRQKECVPDKK